MASSAADGVMELFIGLNSVMANQLPVNLFPPYLIQAEFDKFAEKLVGQQLQPLINNVAQLYQNHASFAVTQNGKLFLVVEVPLRSIHEDPRWVRMVPERTLMNINNTVWEFHTERELLLHQGTGKTLEISHAYVEDCYPAYHGLICPKLPAADTASCLGSLIVLYIWFTREGT